MEREPEKRERQTGQDAEENLDEGDHGEQEKGYSARKPPLQRIPVSRDDPFTREWLPSPPDESAADPATVERYRASRLSTSGTGSGSEALQRDLTSLVRSVKENFDTKLRVFRKAVQENMETNKHEARAALETAQRDAEAQFHSLAESLERKVSHALERVDSVDPDALVADVRQEIDVFRADIETKLDTFQQTLGDFDVTIFMNELREAFQAQIRELKKRNEELQRHLKDRDRKIASLKGEINRLRKMVQEGARRGQGQGQEQGRGAGESASTTPVERLPGPAAPTSVPEHEGRQTLVQGGRIASVPADARDFLSPDAREAAARDSFNRSAREVPYPGPEPKQGRPAEVPYPGQGAEKAESRGPRKRQVMFCKNCGRQRSRPDARFCTYCGQPF